MILLNGHTLQARDRFRAESMSLSIEERNTTATLTVGPDAPEIGINDWLKDDTEPGAGIVWRVKNVRRQIETDTRTISLEHVIQVLRDSLIFGEVKADGMGGGGGSCTARQAIAYALGRQAGNIWRLGDVQVNPSNPYAFNGDSVYSAIETVTGSLDGVQWEYDLSSLPFTLHIRREPSGFESEMRMSRNISSLSIQIDRSRMYTRHYPTGKNNLHLSGGGYTSRNEATWGVVCRTETDGSIETEAALRAWSQSRLNKHCEPTVTVTVGGIDLSRDTGEPLDRITVGRKCRLPLPEYGTTMTEKVTKISWADKVKEPDRFTVTMANLQEDVARILSSQIAGSSRGGRTAQKKAEEDHAWFVDTTDHVAMVAEAVAGEGAAEDWSRVSSIVVDGDGIHQRVVKTEGELVTHQTAIEANEKAISIEAKSRADADTELSGRIDVTDQNVTIEVKARKDGDDTLSGRIDVTDNNVTIEVKARKDGDDALSGRIDVTESAITAEVTNREAGDRALRGALIVEAGKASLVAELTDDRPIVAFDSSADFPEVGDTSIIYLDNTDRIYYEWTGSRYKIVNPGAVIKASAITTAINEAGESETHIDSDHVYIGNSKSTTVINGKLETKDITTTLISGVIANISTVTVKGLTCSGSVSLSGTTTLSGTVNIQGSDGYTRDLATGIRTLYKHSESGGTVTLRYIDFNGAEHDVSFSRAISSASWEWTNGMPKVTLQPQDQAFTGRQITHGTPYQDTQDNNRWKMEIQEIDSSTTPPRYNTISGRTIPLWNYLEAKTGSEKITANGTYTPGTGKIGYSEVVVDVPSKMPSYWQWFGGTNPGDAYVYLGELPTSASDVWYAIYDANRNIVARFVEKAVPPDPHTHSASLIQALDDDAGGSSHDAFYGELYAKDGSSYVAIAGSNKYWYYSGTNMGGNKTVYWE